MIDTSTLSERLLKSKNPIVECGNIMGNMQKALEAANRLCFHLEHKTNKKDIIELVKKYRELENSI